MLTMFHQKQMDTMKTQKLIQVLSLSLILSFSGAAGCGSLNPGARAAVVRGEQAYQMAADTFDAFLKAERLWESKQADPTAYRTSSIHQYAEIVRKQGIVWVNLLKV